MPKLLKRTPELRLEDDGNGDDQPGPRFAEDPIEGRKIERLRKKVRKREEDDRPTDELS